MPRRRVPSHAHPRCIHGTSWDACATCARYTWCRECLALIELDEPPRDGETILCANCDPARVRA